MRRVLFLKRVPLLAELHTSDLSVLAEGIEERLSRRGSVLLRGGEPVSAIHFVLQGRAQIARRGRELGFAEPGSVIGGRLLLAQDLEGLDAVVEEDTTSLSLDREAFLDALEDRFEIFLRILRTACRDMVELLKRFPREAAPPPARPLPPLSGSDLDLVDRIVLLTRTPFWAYGVDALAELSQRLEEVRLAPGTVLWRRGDRATGLLIVARGTVRCTPERDVSFLARAGESLGVLEALGHLPRWHDAIAEEPVVALEGDAEQIIDVLEDNLEMGFGILSHLVRLSIELRERAAKPDEALGLVEGDGMYG